MSLSSVGDCVQGPGDCPSCPGSGEPGVTINKPMFGASTPMGNSQKTAYDGLMNFKQSRTSASSFTLWKKSLMTVNADTLPSNLNPVPPNSSYSNTGGPGDNIKSVPIITSKKSGWRGRLVSQPRQTGVDVKHGSYERYLARKRGHNMRAVCDGC